MTPAAGAVLVVLYSIVLVDTGFIVPRMAASTSRLVAGR